MNQKVIIVDFGSQVTQLIARRVREQNVYCEIQPYHKPLPQDPTVKGVIFSGGPSSVNDSDAPDFDVDSVIGNLPVLGICYGAQLIAKKSGGKVQSSETREYGRAMLNSSGDSPLFRDLEGDDNQVWMSHGDTITDLPAGYHVIGSTDSVHVAAYQHDNLPVFALQFHPEVTHSLHGADIIRNFLIDICGIKPDWTPASFIEETVADLKAQIGGQKVICGLSGGVDSTVAASLIHRAIGDDLTCIFVDNGILRKGEFEQVMHMYSSLGLNVIGVDAADQFLDALDGVTDPETKRKTIGKIFIDVFQQEADKLDGITFLAQGTIYPDVIESVSVKGPSATIKSHHNVGGLPEQMKLKVVEPLKYLFKDEVRNVGRDLGLSEQFIGRHPFPGPGLAIRILGEITRERVALLQEVDAIFINELRDKEQYDQVWQAFAVLLPINSVGVMGDERTYEQVVALRAVGSRDGMTADWSRLPYEFLGEVSNKIINGVKGVNRVVYDISSKPPATIEWE
ncbi:glutamine-hydrolyzing GMP synthase [Pontibacter sp. G13]|uniref:glutamine-hydrolyzing GMP synthase n=1 Tax=Pontibacter sp. G13 TaxID=3074898 RepID=UPI00288C18A4|nr:glutamine-hydrolyzing GMP synthase [Pontibacter sp. G13]WNJ20058.1 glutamine-hydrolyzing GMP synthase [Pontibacter sp. G13]